MVRRYLAVLGAVALLSACAHTEVHLFGHGLEEGESERVSSALWRKGFKTRLNELDPPILDGPTVIYSPGHRDTDEITALLETLGDLGYPNVSLAVVAKGNHAFTGNNVGVYLGLGVEDAQEPRESKLAKEYTGVCSSVDAYLTLNVEGRFDLEVIEWDEQETRSVVKGAWNSSGNTVELTIDEATVEYQIKAFERTDQYGRTKGARLAREGPEGTLRDCDFVYTEFESL